MQGLWQSPGRSALAGLVLAVAVLLVWLLVWGEQWRQVYLPGLAMVIVRFVHVLAAMVWVGLVWYVNFVQLLAVEELDPAGRAAIHKAVAPRAALWFRHMSTLTLASGVVLALFTSYLTFGGIAAPRAALLALAMLGGLVMWVLVHMVIWPAMRVILAGGASEPELAEARRKVKTYARVNLMLALPVTFAMVGAAHLV